MKRQKTLLSVNVNKAAALRNARGGNIPDLLEITRLLIDAGAESITVHPRPDERHIRYQDTRDLKKLLTKYKGRTEYNIEGFPSEKFLRLMEEVRPDQCTLVPDPPEALTSDAGWALTQNSSLLESAVERLKAQGARVSLFIDPFRLNKTELFTLKNLSPDRIELYTKRYADSRPFQRQEVSGVYKKAARQALALKIGVNAGHDLNQKNLPDFLKAVPEVQEVSIGQAFIADCLKDGITAALNSYLKIIQEAFETSSKISINS